MPRWNGLKQFDLPPRVIHGYVIGLAASCLAFWLLPLTWSSSINYFNGTSAPGDHPISFTIYVFMAVGALLIMVPTISFGFIFTFPTFFLFYFISWYLRISHFVYFAVAGGVSGYLIAELFQSAVTPFHNFWIVSERLWMPLCGAIGGLVYWWIAVHRSPAVLARHPTS
jgi:hypothetical protein